MLMEIVPQLLSKYVNENRAQCDPHLERANNIEYLPRFCVVEPVGQEIYGSKPEEVA